MLHCITDQPKEGMPYKRVKLGATEAYLRGLEPNAD